MFTVTDALGDVQIPLPVTIDTRPPALTLVDAHALRFSLDEPATVTLLVNGTTRIVIAEPKGVVHRPVPGERGHTLGAGAGRGREPQRGRDRVAVHCS